MIMCNERENMMKKVLYAAAAIGALAASPAMAQSATFAVTGTIQASCGTINNLPIAFGTIATNADGTLTAAQSKSSASQAVYCNGINSTITVASTPLVNTVAPDDASFTGTLNYTTNVNFAGSSFGVGATQALGAKAGNMVVSANNLTATGGLRPYAGSYDGAITVTLSPAA